MGRPAAVEIGPVRASVLAARGQQGERWYWRARTKGEAERRAVWSGWATRDEVAVALAGLVARGLPSQVVGPADARTVGEALAMWADAQAARVETGQIAHATGEGYRRTAAYWVESIGDVRLDALTRAAVGDVVTGWLREGVGQRTAAQSVLTLRIALKWAHERGAPKPPELARMLRVDEQAHVNNAATPERGEVWALLAAMPAGRGRDLVELLALTGMRVGEAAAATVGDYDRAGGVLVVHGRDEARQRRGKVRPRRYPVVGELAALVERLTRDRAPGARLVDGLPIQPAAVAAAALEQASRVAGLPAYTAHGLRRMAAMSLLDRGVDARTVSELTGHSVQTLLRAYVRPTADRLRDAVSRLDAGPKVLELRRRREEG